VLSLFLSNILVLVTHVYRMLRNQDENVYAISTEEAGVSSNANHHSFFSCFRPIRARTTVGIIPQAPSRLGSTVSRLSNTPLASRARGSQYLSSGKYTIVGTLTTVNSGSVPTQNWEHDLSQNGTHGELSSRNLPLSVGCQSTVSPDRSFSTPSDESQGSAPLHNFNFKSLPHT